MKFYAKLNLRTVLIKKIGKMKIKDFIKLVIASLLGGLISVFCYSRFFETKKVSIIETSDQDDKQLNVRTIALSGAISDFTSIAEKSINAVVHVKTIFSAKHQKSNIFDFFFGNNNSFSNLYPNYGSGSGVIITSDGYIVTNCHVIEKVEHIEVVLNDKRTFKATIIGTDEATDIALLKIEATDLPTISVGSSDNLLIGEWVLAVGNPFNLTSTVTAGIVSAKARNINLLNDKMAVESFIQTDAAVNPGNSGGALVNSKGELVGINTAIASQSGYYTGYSFAVPIDIVTKIVDDILEFGCVQRAVLGVDIKEVNARIASQLELEKITGVVVVQVADDGAAANAGIEPKDVIIAIENVDISTASNLNEQLNKYRPGDVINVKVNRNNEIQTFKVILQNKNGNSDLVKSVNISDLGAKFEELTDEDKEKYDVEFGVKIVELKAGKLMKHGVKKDYIITHINRTPMKTTSDITLILSQSSGAVLIQVRTPTQKTEYFAFGLD